MAQGDLREHLCQPGSQRENRTNVQVSIGCFIEEDVKAGIHAVFRKPIADHDRYFGQGIQNHRDIGFKLFVYLLSSENMNDVIKERRVDICYSFRGLFTALLEQGITVAAPS